VPLTFPVSSETQGDKVLPKSALNDLLTQTYVTMNNGDHKSESGHGVIMGKIYV
jgi:hypothetical protein